MKLPRTENAPVLRTDFSDAHAWAQFVDAVREPSPDGFVAYVSIIDDPAFKDLPKDRVLALATEARHRFIFVVDGVALANSREYPVLVMDLKRDPGRTFRVIVSEMWNVENNLSVANMGFEEFAEAAGTDGIFRGFPMP